MIQHYKSQITWHNWPPPYMFIVFVVLLQTSCKVSQFIHLYLFACNYFWMLCEGIYLHTLIVVAVFAEKQHLIWYYLLGWGKSSITRNHTLWQSPIKPSVHRFLNCYFIFMLRKLLSWPYSLSFLGCYYWLFLYGTQIKEIKNTNKPGPERQQYRSE